MAGHQASHLGVLGAHSPRLARVATSWYNRIIYLGLRVYCSGATRCNIDTMEWRGDPQCTTHVLKVVAFFAPVADGIIFQPWLTGPCATCRSHPLQLAQIPRP
jgi:hypothetical protein